MYARFLAKSKTSSHNWESLPALRHQGSKTNISFIVAMTKKQRHKYDRKQEKLLKTLPKRIPAHEQSKDLTGPEDGATVSLEKRQEITKSSRVARRKGIRESNFLRSM
jgi:large subunit ribosomal protein L54